MIKGPEGTSLSPEEEAIKKVMEAMPVVKLPGSVPENRFERALTGPAGYPDHEALVVDRDNKPEETLRIANAQSVRAALRQANGNVADAINILEANKSITDVKAVNVIFQL